MFVQGLYKAFTAHLQGVYEEITMFLQGCLHKVLTRLVQGWLIMFYKDLRFVFARCFTRLLLLKGFCQALNGLLQGFYQFFTKLSQGVYKAFKGFVTRFSHV